MVYGWILGKISLTLRSKKRVTSPHRDFPSPAQLCQKRNDSLDGPSNDKLAKALTRPSSRCVAQFVFCCPMPFLSAKWLESLRDLGGNSVAYEVMGHSGGSRS